MDKIIYSTKAIPFEYCQFKAYRIEVDVTDPNHTFQRHVWIDENDDIIESEWIETPKQTVEQLIYRNYYKIGE